MEKGKIMKKVDNVVDKYSWPIYFYSLISVNLVYILLFFGVLSIGKEYINNMNIFIQIFVCAFLIYRFNPLRTAELREYDSKIIFGSAILLLTNLGFTQYVYVYTKKVLDDTVNPNNYYTKIQSYFGFNPTTNKQSQEKPQNITMQNNMDNTL